MAGKGYEKRWEIESELGRGGQGIVHRVLDLTKSEPKKQTVEDFIGCMNTLIGGQFSDKNPRSRYLKRLQESLPLLVNPNHVNFAALKVLHSPENARDSATADERIRREITAIQTIKHPNLVEVIEANADEQWYVSRYYPNGDLTKKRDRFKGDFPTALRAFRGLVEGVTAIHKADYVHRDIKPENIFIADDGSLVLGDFGLVFFQDEAHTRVSETIGNVGTRAWMPPWAYERRVEDLRSTFDVFSLGKVLWSMVSGRETLPFWYFNEPDREDLNVEKQFPHSPSIELANELFAKCIVQKEKDCLGSAEALLAEVDRTLLKIERGGTRLRENIVRHCGVCGIGTYKLQVKGGYGDHNTARNFGLTPIGVRSFRICACDHCGHVQFFLREVEKDAPAWRD